MKYPKKNPEANIRLEWVKTLDDDTEEEYIIDAYIELGDPEWLPGQWVKDIPVADADIDLLEVYQKVNDTFKVIDIDTINADDLTDIEQALISQAERNRPKYLDKMQRERYDDYRDDLNDDYDLNDSDCGYDPMWDSPDE